jgi:hypothetical protein
LIESEMRQKRQLLCAEFAVSFLAAWFSSSIAVSEALALSRGQVVYVPIYSQIWYRNLDSQGKPSILLLSSMVSIRNTDPDHSITVRSVRYYGADGKLLRDDSDVRNLGPLASTEVFIEYKDTTGGTGANFLVVWDADTPANPPIIESVNVNYTGTALTAFTSRGRPLLTSTQPPH